MIWGAVTALLTGLWWIGALLAPPLPVPPAPAEAGPPPVPSRLPRRRATRATLLPSLLLPVVPLVAVRTIDAHAGVLQPAMPAVTALTVLFGLFLLRSWLGGLFEAGGIAGPRQL
ncbi:hypothetical protein NGM37_32520, partial [Streptomyces sp. TRM76130]|nr:hypothetical protein [Streptomyces sp. TRM76130]